MNKYYQNCLNCLKGLYFLAYNKAMVFIKEHRKQKDFFNENLFSHSAQEQPARILSTDEIDNIVKKQLSHNDINLNVNEYKIVKQDIEENIDSGDNKLKEMKHEIENFEEEEKNRNDYEKETGDGNGTGEMLIENDIEKLKDEIYKEDDNI